MLTRIGYEITLFDCVNSTNLGDRERKKMQFDSLRRVNKNKKIGKMKNVNIASKQIYRKSDLARKR